jgi:hypothetical protein
MHSPPKLDNDLQATTAKEDDSVAINSEVGDNYDERDPGGTRPERSLRII